MPDTAGTDGAAVPRRFRVFKLARQREPALDRALRGGALAAWVARPLPPEDGAALGRVVAQDGNLGDAGPGRPVGTEEDDRAVDDGTARVAHLSRDRRLAPAAAGTGRTGGADSRFLLAGRTGMVRIS